MGKQVTIDFTVTPSILYKLVHLIIALNFLDAFSTWIGFSIGLGESNSLASFAPIFLLAKFGFCFALYPVMYIVTKKVRSEWLFIPLVFLLTCITILSLVVSWNTAMLLRSVTV